MAGMKGGKDPQASVDAFLASRLRRDPCKTCSCTVRAQVEAACEHFAARRREGATSVPWHTFVRLHLSSIGYPARTDALIRHLRKCLGWKEIP